MKVVAFNGSPKREGNTYHSLKLMCDELNKKGIETEIINVGKESIRGCIACMKCLERQDKKCIIAKDKVNEYIDKIMEADGIILASPVYFSGVNGTMKSFLDRAFMVSAVNNNLFRNKVGTAIAAVRRSGGIPTVDQLNYYLHYSEMLMPSSNYWNVAHGMNPGEMLQDEEGVQIMQTLGRNMAYLLELREAGKDIELPEQAQKVMTNFIR